MAGAAGGGAMIGGAERGCGTILRGSGVAARAAAGVPRRRGSAGCAAWRSWLAQARLQPAWPATRRGAPLLPLPSSWPEWPSSHRRAWRCARDRFWGRWLARLARGRAPPCCRQASRSCAKVRANLLGLVRLRANWSGSCPQPRRVPAERRESRETLLPSLVARSLIRTLLIRLFSMSCCQSP